MSPIIHKDLRQGTEEWLRVRLGRPTASEFKNILTPEFKTRTGEMFTSYVARKIAEAWRGSVLPGFTSWATEQGQEREDEARAWCALELELDLRTVGFIEGADGRCGCSPDALCGEYGGLELKAPNPETHVGYLLRGVLPSDYATQVHGSLYVSGRKWWKFVSYARRFPAFVLTVQRDEAICSKIESALREFYRQFDDGMERLSRATKVSNSQEERVGDSASHEEPRKGYNENKMSDREPHCGIRRR